MKSVKAKRWLAVIIAVVLIFISIGFRFTMNLASGFLNGMFDMTSLYEEHLIESGDLDERIAVLNLEGIIGQGTVFATGGYEHQHFMQMVEDAGEDPTVSAIILKVNSPGGAVAETAEIHRALVEIQEDYDKPIYVSMGNTAASGGYYAAAPADKIFAQPSTLTGSIGVIMESINFGKFAEKHGIEFNTIKSGKHKDIMSANREMTKEEKDILQSMIDEMYDDFVDVIVDGRDLSEEKVRELGDGRIYTGKQAKENGLVDELGSFEDTLAAMKEDYQLENAEVFQYDYNIPFMSAFIMEARSFVKGESSEIEAILSLLRESDRPRAMYLY